MQCNSTNVRYISNHHSCLTAEGVDRQSLAFKAREPVTKNYARYSDRFKTSPIQEFDWQALVETANVMILIFDSKNYLCYANAMVKTVTGYTKVGLLKNTDLLPQLRLLQEQANLAEHDQRSQQAPSFYGGVISD